MPEYGILFLVQIYYNIKPSGEKFFRAIYLCTLAKPSYFFSVNLYIPLIETCIVSHISTFPIVMYMVHTLYYLDSYQVEYIEIDKYKLEYNEVI